MMYLDKLFKILEVVVKSGAGLTVSDINKITAPKPSCYKLINDLVKNDLYKKKIKIDLF